MNKSIFDKLMNRTMHIFVAFLLLVSCSSSREETVTENITGDVTINGIWLVSKVEFTGDISRPKFSKEVNLYSLFGEEWNSAQGEQFVFGDKNKFSSTMFGEMDQSLFTYQYTDSLILNIKNNELDYSFNVSVINLDSKSMTLDIGNDILVTLERSNE